jgi:hypothetical protein
MVLSNKDQSAAILFSRIPLKIHDNEVKEILYLKCHNDKSATYFDFTIK